MTKKGWIPTPEDLSIKENPIVTELKELNKKRPVCPICQMRHAMNPEGCPIKKKFTTPWCKLSKQEKLNWHPDDYVRIMKNTLWTTNDKIAAWKSFCLTRGKAMGFDLDIKKLEKSVNDQFVGMGLEVSGSFPIPEHHNTNPILELSIQTWQKFAAEIMRGTRAFCSAHSIPKITLEVINNLICERIQSPGFDPKEIENLVDDQPYRCTKIARMLGIKDSKTIYRDWPHSKRGSQLNASALSQIGNIWYVLGGAIKKFLKDIAE